MYMYICMYNHPFSFLSSLLPTILPYSLSLSPMPSTPCSSQLLDTFNLTGLIASATSSIGDISIDAADLIPRDQIDSIRSTLPSELTFGTGLIGTVNGTLMTASMNLTAASEQLAVIVNVSQMANEVSVQVCIQCYV